MPFSQTEFDMGCAVIKGAASTIISKLTGAPAQPLISGVTVYVNVTAEADVFISVCAGIVLDVPLGV